MYKPHPVFRAVPAQGRLRRYCDLAKLISLLSKRALYFPLASVLDDPYEGVLPRSLAQTLPRDIIPVMEKSRYTGFVRLVALA